MSSFNLKLLTVESVSPAESPEGLGPDIGIWWDENADDFSGGGVQGSSGVGKSL